MEFVTELSGVLALLPALLISLTNNIKGLTGRWTFLVPYLLGVLIMLLLFVAFNETSVYIYVVNGILFGYGASVAYDTGKDGASKTFEDFGLMQ